MKISLLLALSALALPPIAAGPQPHLSGDDPGVELHWPGKRWEAVEDLADAGWSEEGLAAVAEHAAGLDTSALMVIDRGRVVLDWGETERRFKCHSMRKSFLSALYGPHVAEGDVSLDATLADLDIDDKQGLTDGERQATVRMLLQARSGVYHPACYETKAMTASKPPRGSHAPGTFWHYNNWDFNALGTLFRGFARAGIGREFDELIADPIGMQDFRRSDVSDFLGPESEHPAYPFVMSARDAARFGLLFCRGGVWGDDEVIPSGWVKESTAPHSRTSSSGTRGYGYMWWTDEDPTPYPGVDHGGRYFWASGHRGHRILVAPSIDLVIVHRVDTFEADTRVSGAGFGELQSLIFAARVRPGGGGEGG